MTSVTRGPLVSDPPALSKRRGSLHSRGGCYYLGKCERIELPITELGAVADRGLVT